MNCVMGEKNNTLIKNIREKIITYVLIKIMKYIPDE